MVGLLDARACSQSDVASVEKRGVFGDLQLSCFLQSREEKSQCGWCVVSSFASLFLRAGVSSLLVSSVFFWSGSGVKKVLLYCFSLLIRSNWVFFVFYGEGHRLAQKLLLIIFIFWQISSTFRYALILCTEVPFTILKKVSASITSGECSRGCLVQSLFCVYDKLEEISFGHITILLP